MSINNMRKINNKLNKEYAKRINTTEEKAAKILDELKKTNYEEYEKLLDEMLVDFFSKEEKIEETNEILDIKNEYVVSTEFIVWTPATIQGITEWINEVFEDRFGAVNTKTVKIFIRNIGDES
jgi:hypothetical protein